MNSFLQQLAGSNELVIVNDNARRSSFTRIQVDLSQLADESTRWDNSEHSQQRRRTSATLPALPRRQPSDKNLGL